MKKKICLITLLLIVVGVGIMFIPKDTEYDYLRIHIRANSNSTLDQNMKYEIKDKVMELLTPYLYNIPSKDKAKQVFYAKQNEIQTVCNNLLFSRGLNYGVKLSLNNQYFPARMYDNVTLDSGFYDAIIIDLGEGNGDNWWCVMYPPLCFVNRENKYIEVNYRSKIAEWFQKIFK